MDWQAVRAGFEDEFMKISEMSLAGLSAETLMNYPQAEPMPSAAYEKAQQIIAKMQPKDIEKTSAPKDWARVAVKAALKDVGAEGRRTFKRTVNSVTSAVPTYFGVRAASKDKTKKKRKKRKTVRKTKTADGIRPDQLPQLRRLYLKRKRKDEPPPGKIDNVLAYGGHTLAGAGTAKFTGDAIAKGMAAHHQAAQKAGKKGLKIMSEKYYEGKLPPRVERNILAVGAALGLARKIHKEHRRKKWQEGQKV